MTVPESHLAPLLADLNAPQQEAVLHRDGPLLIIAGPGSGKTRVITRRAAALVHTGVRPHNILAITFTNKAADEMKRRIEALGVAHGMWVYTFHALGARLLREFGALADVQAGFSIYDEDDAARVMKDALEAEGISQAYLKPDAARAQVSDAKSRLLMPADVAQSADTSQARTLARAYERYQALLHERNAVDFDDLLMRVAVVLRDHPDVAERLSIRFRYVLIDEYQDTNHAQYLIARLLGQHGNICAAGDPDQSIYRWRGADIRNILEFEEDFPKAVVVRLEQNYRSSMHILRAASRLIARNTQRKHKELWSSLGEGAPVHVLRFSRGEAEATHVASRIAELHAAGRAYRDMAIFYRVNALSREIEDALRYRGIPYRIARGVAFYSRKEVRDVLGYLRVLMNPADDVALLRIINTPARGIGKTTIDRLQTYANEHRVPLLEAVRTAQQVPQLGVAKKRVTELAALLERLRPLTAQPPDKAVETVIERTGLERFYRQEDEVGGEDRLANIQELVTSAVRFRQLNPEATLADYLNHISLMSDQDRIDESAGVVHLMTLHAAKGLEFPVVFILGLEQGLLPHDRALGFDAEHAELEEERRLCFVGMTRAQELLYLTHAAQRYVRGRVEARTFSQFLLDIEHPEVVKQNVQDDSFRPRALGATAPLPRRPAKMRDGLIPTYDDLPPDEAVQRGAAPRWRDRGAEAAEDPDLPDDDHHIWRSRKPAGPAATSGASAASSSAVDGTPASFADWKPGMFVQHKQYGLGQLLWLRPGPGQTRAGIKFPAYGEKTLVLEFAPVELLQRK